MNPMINSLLTIEKKLELEEQLHQTNRQRPYNLDIYMNEGMPLRANLGRSILAWLPKFRRKPHQIRRGYSLEVEC